MKRIIRGAVLSALMVFAVLSMNVQAEENQGKLELCDELGYYTYEVKNGEATITKFGTGFYGPLDIRSELNGYPVTAIAEEAFSECNITSVTIPSSVKTIGKKAFEKCKISSATIEGGVKTIGQGAFNECTKLESVTIAGSVKSVSPWCFSECEKLSYVHLGFGIEVIEKGAFNLCKSLTFISIPESVMYFGTDAFANSGLKSITIPSSVTYIYNTVFYNCSQLVDVKLHDRVQYIGNNVFEQCTALENIKIPGSVEHIGEKAFLSCANLKSVSILNNGVSIGDMAFSACSPGLTISSCGPIIKQYAADHSLQFQALDHAFDAGVIKTKATCTTKGLKVRTCTCCGETTEEVLPVATHSFNIYDKCTNCGEYASYIHISIPKMKVKSISKAKGALTVRWTKNKKVKGYEIRYSTKSDMSTAKTVKITKYKTTSKKIKNLKKEKKYYVQIRAYKTIDGTKMYSPWSAVKSQKTK